MLPGFTAISSTQPVESDDVVSKVTRGSITTGYERSLLNGGALCERMCDGMHDSAAFRPQKANLADPGWFGNIDDL